MLGEIIEAAKDKGIKVILIAEDVSPAALHQLLRHGADEFIPYRCLKTNWRRQSSV